MSDANKVIPIEANLPHKISELICVMCCKRWIDVRPEGVKLIALECPGCGKRGYVIETGEEIGDED